MVWVLIAQWSAACLAAEGPEFNPRYTHPLKKAKNTTKL